VHASIQREPFGRTIIEALACGCAVTVANAGGAAELFTDGVDALGYAMGDAAALARVLERLVADRALRGRLGRAGRDTVVARFSAERLGEAFASIYGRLSGANVIEKSALRKSNTHEKARTRHGHHGTGR
jgi:glycosyltransferase involved in cell wall biosynthesis